MLTWKNWKKTWSLGLAFSLWGKMGGNHLIWGVMRWKLKWREKTWVWEKMVSKCELLENIPLHGQGLNYKINVCELKKHVGEKGRSLNWLVKLMFAKKPLPTSFPNRLLENVWIKSMFPYALLPRHEGAKQNTIGIIRGASAKLSHCTSLALAYPMENDMPFLHHAVE